jgi:hypothetical protein
MIGGSSPGRDWESSPHHRVQIGSGANQAPIQWVPGALTLGVKRPERVSDHLSASSAEVKNAWSYTSTLQYAFMVWCSVKKKAAQAFSPCVMSHISNFRSEFNDEYHSMTVSCSELAFMCQLRISARRRGTLLSCFTKRY